MVESLIKLCEYNWYTSLDSLFENKFENIIKNIFENMLENIFENMLENLNKFEN